MNEAVFMPDITKKKFNLTLFDIVMCALIVTSIALYDIKLVFLGLQAVAFFITFLYVIGNQHMLKGTLVYYLLWLGAFVFYGVCSLLWASRENVTAITVTLSVIQVGLIAFCILYYCAFTRKTEFALWCFVFAALVFCARFFLTVPSSMWGQAARFKDYGVFGSNTPAMVMAYASIILILMCFFKENPLKNKVFPLICVFMFMFISVLMGTKKSLLIFAVCMIIFLLGSAKNPVKLMSRLALIGVAVVGVYFLFTEVPMLYNSIGYRIEGLFSLFDSSSGGEVDASTEDRAEHIVKALQAFVRHPLLGLGQDGYRYTNAKITYSHNNYVELLANLGIAGFSIYYALYVWIIRRGLRIFKRNMLPVCISVAILLADIAIVSYSFESVYVLSAMSLALIMQSQNDASTDV